MRRVAVIAALACAPFCIPRPASAQPVIAAVDVRAGGLVSIQPKGYDGGSPYLDNGLGGIVPGASIAVKVAAGGGPVLTVELGSTTSLAATQSGRFVIGLGPDEARHRDTLLSILAGVRLGRRVAVEVKGGFSLLFGTPRREGYDFDDPAGIIVYTGGADIVVPISDRMAIIPTARYTYANRGENAFYFGLNNHIIRAGVAVAFTLAPRTQNAERRTQNAERRTKNEERRTKNEE